MRNSSLPFFIRINKPFTRYKKTSKIFRMKEVKWREKDKNVPSLFHQYMFMIHANIVIPGADPGFVVRGGGGVSRRGVWGPLLGPQRVEGRALIGVPGGRSPPEALGV